MTTVTYAADDTIAKSITAEHTGQTHHPIWVVYAGIAGLVAGLVLLVASRNNEGATSSAIQ